MRRSRWPRRITVHAFPDLDVSRVAHDMYALEPPLELQLAHKLILCIVSEVITLKLRRPGSGHEYLYPQIFAGLAYLVASGCMYELRRVNKRKKWQECCP